ncbi:LysR family transcriptional regulator [Paenibacillus sp. FSL R5-0527]|uniref:LysR family transcriptional regulator n=1 Tax=Paenibacillus sp. FSL R5-0527 TaxID=2975321 RepID=UPI00097B67D8|nr:LysR family transcriptional regulator [Paenibacillus macerans]
MELLQLQYFRTVARLEHMTKAAEEIRIAQPALSQTIARLEADLGVPLFDRNGRHIKLNGYGEAFLKKIEPALALIEEGRAEVADLAGLECGRVFLSTTTHKCFTDVIGSFIFRHPKARLQITQASTLDKIKQLRSGDIDFCITFPPLQEEGIEGISFLTENINIAVPLAHRLANRSSIDLSELADDPFICIHAQNPFRQMTDAFCEQAGFAPNVVCEVDELSGVIHFLRTGIGVAFLPETLFEGQEMGFRLIRIETPDCRRTYQIAWLKDRYLSVAARTFRDYVVDYFQEQPKQYKI